MTNSYSKTTSTVPNVETLNALVSKKWYSELKLSVDVPVKFIYKENKFEK